MKNLCPVSTLLCVSIILVLCSMPALWGEEPPSPGSSVGDIPPWAKVAPQQIAEAEQFGVPVAFENSIGMRFVLIPGGKFLMGSPEDEEDRSDNEGPQHEVTLYPFYLAVTEVTNAQYGRFKPEHYIGESRGRSFYGDDQPVVKVSHEDSTAFLRWLSEREGGRACRLPSEAEWEYACRAGSTARWCFGGEESRLAEYAWYEANADDRTHAVGLLEPNAWGLFDMHGNAWEWCEDRWHNSYSGAPIDGSGWVESGLAERVCRGGSWLSHAGDARSAARGRVVRSRGRSLGFRAARDVVGEEE